MYGLGLYHIVPKAEVPTLLNIKFLGAIMYFGTDIKS